MVLVGMAEIGDKSLLLTLLLMVRYRRPWPILLGMLTGMAANLALAAGLGSAAADWLSGDLLGWLIGLSFLAMAAWTLVPESEGTPEPVSRGGLFVTAAVSYFVLEMADKTQLATLALAARFDVFLPVLLGAMLGVVLVNAPAIWLGHRFAARLPVVTMRRVCALLFLLLGLWILAQVSGLLAVAAQEITAN